MNKELLEEIKSTATHQFNMAEASDDSSIDDYTKVPYSKYIDWKILLKMNDGEGAFHRCLSFEKRHKLLERIKKYEQTNLK